jgi:phage baseplate assembly protein W
MAILLGRKFPIDTQPARAVGVALPFNAPGVFTSNYTTSKQLNSNLINFFLTNRGERVLDPTYGANLRAVIFEQITEGNLDALKSKIELDLTTNFPDVRLANLDILGNEDLNEIQVRITYTVVLSGETDTISLNFNQ